MKKIIQKLSTLFQKAAAQQKGRSRKTRGQSLVEVAIAFPFMIMLLGGVVEFGFMINYYLSLLDATRYAARLYSGADPFDPAQSATWFYNQTAVTVINNLDPVRTKPDYVGRRIIVDPAIDDVIVTVYSVKADGTTIRYPVSGEYHIFGVNNFPSIFTASKIQSQHNQLTGAPKEGILTVEVVYNYHQVLALPWMVPFGNPIPMRAYSIFPLIAAEPN